MSDLYDIVVVGGGINGCGIARDAAGRGYSVLLCEQSDLASGTSSGSTKLIHGGLRYLEHYEFRLVREALIERERLWASAPHIIWPLRFILPHHKGLRPAWLLRIGLFLYDHLGGRRALPVTRSIDLARSAFGAPLREEFTRGFEYSDCWVDDSRLVVLNARDAANKGARILTRTRAVGAERTAEGWRLRLHSATDREEIEVAARLVVNAAGPWTDQLLRGILGRNDVRNVRLVKGSHLVVRKLYDHDRCYIFQNADGRIVFAIPYEDEFTLIGTTDEDFDGDPKDAKISKEETAYLCEAVSAYLKSPVSPSDVVWTYSAVRPLFDDGASKAQEATRDYVLKEDRAGGAALLINVFGGKITTFRRLAESVLEKIAAELGPRGAPWTAGAALPGGSFPMTERDEVERQLVSSYGYLGPSLAARLVRQYGTDATKMLLGCASAAELGRHFGAGLYEREVEWLMDKEWAVNAEDIAWRRSKLGLKLKQEEMDELELYMKDRAAKAARTAA